MDSIGYNYITKGKTLSNLVNGIESHGWKQVYVQNNTLTYIATRPNNEDGHGFNFDYSANTENGVLNSKIVCDSVVVRGNIFAYAVANGGTNSLGGNVGAGIQLYYTGVDNEIYDNICYGNGYGLSIINPSASTAGNRVYNNTFFGNDIGIKTASSQLYILQTDVRNNIVAGSRIKGWWNSLSVTILPNLIGNNLWWNNSNFLNITQGLNDILGNALFADTLNKDFRILDINGAGIDEATNVTLFHPFPHQRNSDHSGNFVPVNNLSDIGAHEYGSSGSSNSINANVKILLEGSYSNGSMTTTLLSNGHIPINQPYNQLPWSYSGNESVAAIPSNVVDWILVELRTGTTSSTTVARKAAFIKSNGYIVGLDGVNPLSFNDLSAGDYYIVIRHRNHLPIMSSNPITLSMTSSLYDFTTGPDKSFGNNPVANLGNGNWGMFAGDGDLNGLINVIDYGSVGNFLFQTGYKIGDLDLNGVINVMDYAKTNLNLFKNSQVPN
jgi:hypothetical protein